MDITILTYGSRGDVQPFLQLSLGLMTRGHSVKLAVPRDTEYVSPPLAGNPEDLSRKLNDAGHNFVRMMGEIMSHAFKIVGEVSRQVEEYCDDADLIVHTFLHAAGGHSLARKKNIPDVHIQNFPMFAPTRDYPNITMSNLGFRALNRLTHAIAGKVTRLTSRWRFEYVRCRAGLPAQKLYWLFDDDPLHPPTPILCAWSPSVLPPSSDWSSNVHVTGYFFFDGNASYQPPAELQTFLDAGDPLVCVSFGSMVNRDAEKIDRIVREALTQTSQRGVILSGWGKLKRSLTKKLLYLETVPHAWLPPRCKMVVHHGGAWTTSAGLVTSYPVGRLRFYPSPPTPLPQGEGRRAIEKEPCKTKNLIEASIPSPKGGGLG